MNNVTRTFCAMIMVATALLLSPVVHAATVNDLLQYMPADAHIAIGLPDIAAVEEAGAPLMSIGPLAQINDLVSELGGETLAEGLSQAGVAASAPGAVFLTIGETGNLSVSGVLLVADETKVKDKMTSLLSGEGTEVSLPGEIKGRFAANSGIGYFLNEGKVFIGSAEPLLQGLAGRIAEPAVIHYGKDVSKDEVVVWSRIDIIEANSLLTRMDELKYLKPLIDTIKPFSDEVILAIGEQAGKAYVRLAARDNSGAAVASPGALKLHGFMDPDMPALLNLRITPQLVNAISMTLIANESTRQAGGYIRLAGSFLGDEVAIGFKGMKDDKIPDAVIAAAMKQPEAALGLLKMAKIEQPKYQYEGADVYVAEEISPGVSLHITVSGSNVIVAPGEDALKAALANFAKTDAAGGVSETIVNRGSFGFVMLDGAKAKDLPIDKDLSKVNLAATLGTDNEWREFVITSPAGFDGIASTLESVM